jgi:hypothetical protein
MNVPGSFDRPVPPPPPAPVYAVGDVVNGHMWNGTAWIPMQAPSAVAAAQPVVINNVVSSSASAVSTAVAFRPYRRQSLWVHFWLFCFTAGIGNYFYWRSVRKWNHGY